MEELMHKEGKKRSLRKGDRILYDGKNRLITVWDKNGSILTFGSGDSDKLIINFIRNKTQFVSFCCLVSLMSGLHVKVVDDVETAPGRLYWACQLF
jgi:hypothetical protein